MQQLMKNNIKTFTIVFFFFILAIKSASGQEVVLNKMTFKWHFENNLLHCEVSSPEHGWIAIGINTSNQLKGSNLIMGSAESDFYEISDRFIVKAGDHRSVISLNGKEAISNRKVTESANGTTMSFSITPQKEDDYHHKLIEGQEYYILLAYSVSDDFDHHSRMRETIKIKL
jgi:hypothetical protein